MGSLPAQTAAMAPSDWVRRWQPLLRPGCTVLDVACGSGRHLRWLSSLGYRVTGVDRDTDALKPLAGVAEVIAADIEAGPWPLEGRQFEVVLITHYLWRPLWPQILGSLSSGGILIVETFAQGQETVGRPSRPAFLLRHGELLDVCRGLRVVAYEDGFLPEPQRFVQRIVARREAGLPDQAGPARFPLQGGTHLGAAPR
jgi:SAM-dependent methyltransferase